MLHINDYVLLNDRAAIAKLNNGDLRLPKLKVGYYAIFAPYQAPNKIGLYSVYWFASRKGTSIQKALLIVSNK